MHYSPETILNFGKHKGKLLKEVIEYDINYIVWCLIEIDNFYLDDNSIIEFINNKDKIILNHSRLKNHNALLVALGFEDGDFKTEQNKQVEDILKKIGDKK
jgi:hypothetical protein